MNEKKVSFHFFYVLLFHIGEDYKMKRKESFFITYDEILRCFRSFEMDSLKKKKLLQYNEDGSLVFL